MRLTTHRPDSIQQCTTTSKKCCMFYSKSRPRLTGALASKKVNNKLDNILGMKMITRLGFRFRHLCEPEQLHFPISLICACGTEHETTENFVLRWQRVSQIRSDMLDNACDITKTDIDLLSEELLRKPLLYGEHMSNFIFLSV